MTLRHALKNSWFCRNFHFRFHEQDKRMKSICESDWRKSWSKAASVRATVAAHLLHLTLNSVKQFAENCLWLFMIHRFRTNLRRWRSSLELVRDSRSWQNSFIISARMIIRRLKLCAWSRTNEVKNKILLSWSSEASGVAGGQMCKLNSHEFVKVWSLSRSQVKIEYSNNCVRGTL